MHNFVFNSNDSTCRKLLRLELDQVIGLEFIGYNYWNYFSTKKNRHMVPVGD